MKQLTNTPIHIELRDVLLGAHIEYGVEHNDKDFQFKVGGHVRISKFKNIFAKGYTRD